MLAISAVSTKAARLRQPNDLNPPSRVLALSSPGAAAQRVQPQCVSQLGGAGCARQVLLVGQHQHRRRAQLLLQPKGWALEDRSADVVVELPCVLSSTSTAAERSSSCNMGGGIQG